MSLERTLTIIKPDSTSSAHIGGIIAEIEKAGFRILGMRLIRLSRADAEGTIRNQFGTDIERNAFHSSAAPETAAAEMRFFFSDLDLVG